MSKLDKFGFASFPKPNSHAACLEFQASYNAVRCPPRLVGRAEHAKHA